MTISKPIATLLAVGGMAIVGSSVSISQLILDYPHLTGQAIRYALAAAVFFALAHRFPRLLAGSAATPDDASASASDGRHRPGRPTGRELLVLTALAATGMAGFNAAILTALPHAEPAVVGTVIGAAPLGLALLGPLLRRRRPTTRLVAAAALVVVGTALVQGSGRADATGLLAALGAFAGEVAFTLFAAAVLPRLGAMLVSAYSCALAVPLLLLAALPAGEVARWRLPSATEAVTLGYLAAVMTVVAFLAWFTGLRRLGVERAAPRVGVMPKATQLTPAVQAGRPPQLGASLGVLVVALGIAAGLYARKRARQAPSSAGPVPEGSPEPATEGYLPALTESGRAGRPGRAAVALSEPDMPRSAGQLVPRSAARTAAA